MKISIDKMKNIKILDSYVIGLFLVIIFSFLYFTGTLTSGYHFIDDHSMISMQMSLNDGSFFETAYAYIKNDFNIRFRPLFYLYYVSEIQVFGLNFLVLSIFTGTLAACSFSFFYFGVRKLKFSVVESFLFVLLAFGGSQMAIWWRLGTNETIGIFFLGLAFLFMAKCVNKEKYKSNNIIFAVLLIVTSLCKESFIITIPAFVVFKIWNEKNVFEITFKESMKNNYLLILPIVAMFIELVIIKFAVGTNKIGYAGVTSSVSEFVMGIKNILFNPMSLYLWIKFVGVLILTYVVSLITLKEKKEEKIKSIKYFLVYLCFFVLLVLPNVFMHAKSGMVERYLLPTTIGCAFLSIGIIGSVKHSILRGVMIMATVFFILISFGTSRTNAIIFANEGKQSNVLLKSIRNESKKEDNILLVVDPVNRFEVSYSIKTYLAYYGFNNLYAYPIIRDYDTEFEKSLKNQWFDWFREKKINDIKNKPKVIIIFDKEHSDRFFLESNLDEDDYENIAKKDYPYKIYSIK